MLKFIIILIFITLSFARKDRLQIAFLSSPGNFEVIPSFVKLAEFLTIIKGYGCVSIVHGADRNAWDKSPCTKLKYGESQGEQYLEKLFAAQNAFEEKHLLSADSFRQPFEMLINSFYESKTFFELKRLDIDVLVCDSSNLLCNIVAQKLEIPKKVYHAPTVPSPYWVDYFESSASHHPVMTSPYTNLMGGWQRFRNYINHFQVAHGIRAQRKLFADILKTKEDEKIELDKFLDYNALFTTQAIIGFNYPIYLPPNVANLGCVSCIMPHQVSLELDKFLGKYSQNVFVKIDRINSPDTLKTLIDTIEEFKKVGFIVRADLPKGLKFPANLHRIDYVPTVDILAHSKVHAIIHDGDWASIVESVYYKKPMIALAYRYDRKANGALIEDRGVGICFTKESEITKLHLENSLKSVLDPKSSYAEAMLKYSKIAAVVNTTRQVEKWFDDYIRNGVDHLVVKPFYEMSFVSYYNLDVWFVCLILPALFLCLISTFLAKKVRKARGKKVVGKPQSQPKESEIQKEKTE